MKLGIIGDLHFNSRAPKRRLDFDYLETMMAKLSRALKALKDCHAIIQVGDFFDTPTVSDYTKVSAMGVLDYHDRMIYTIAGQHDITGHSLTTLKNSPLKVLAAAGYVQILGSESTRVGDVNLYGASFGQEVPEAEDGFNVLVTHRMIGNRQLYPDQELESPRVFLRQHPDYDLVLCGDYHYRFSDKYRDQVIVNPGVLIRKSLTDIDMGHTPAVAIFDTYDRSLKFVEIKHDPAAAIFDLTRTEKKSEIDIAAFINRFKDISPGARVGWKNIMLQVAKDKKVKDRTMKLIDDVMVKVKCK